MEIAAYPVPYAAPLFPQQAVVRPVRGNNNDLLPREKGAGSPQERVLQGEVLNGGKHKSSDDASFSSFTFERRAQQATPDLSNLDSRSRQAVQSYLDNSSEIYATINTRSLIDEYV